MRCIAVCSGTVPTANRSLLVDLAIVLALTLIAVVGYKFSPLLLPKADLTLMPAAGCDLNRETCQADVPGGGQITLEIGPQPIPVVKPLHVTATLAGIVANKVELDFAGVVMEMGFNRLTLLRGDDGRYVGETTIPVCVTGRMLWRATLVVETDRQRIAVPFTFEAPQAQS
jgi:hypothetical protein